MLFSLKLNRHSIARNSTRTRKLSSIKNTISLSNTLKILYSTKNASLMSIRKETCQAAVTTNQAKMKQTVQITNLNRLKNCAHLHQMSSCSSNQPRRPSLEPLSLLQTILLARVQQLTLAFKLTKKFKTIFSRQFSSVTL